jgi:two-component system, LytTR family, response regulator
VSELKLVHAQVNPHFLFNALNTINAIIRSDPERARELLVHLSHFFRKNLKRSGELSTLAEELEHVGAYLEIEKARFQDRLTVQTGVDPSLLGIRMPTFTLQPLIENALKHGLSTKLSHGTARIRARREDGQAVIEIEDDAGAYVERRGSGLGMRIVDKRIKALLGDSYGVAVACVPDKLTRVTVRMPAEGGGAMIRALIVDDELHAREELAALLSETGAATVVGSAPDAIAGMRAIRDLRPDVVFLDVQMPAVNGFEMLSMMDDVELPDVVFVTAHDEFAVRAFEEGAVDYVLKPISRERLAKTLERVGRGAPPAARPAIANAEITRVPCSERKAIKLVRVGDIEAVRSTLSGVYVVCPSGEYATDLTLQTLEARAGLLRCHKQYLVNLEAIDQISLAENPAAAIRTRSGQTVPVSRRYLAQIRGRLGSDRSHPGTDQTPLESSRSPDPRGCLGANVVEQGKRGGAA